MFLPSYYYSIMESSYHKDLHLGPKKARVILFVYFLYAFFCFFCYY